MEEKTDKTVEKQKYWLFEKGKSGNPKGRPKGSKSIKDAVRQYLQRHPQDFTDFVEHFIKKNREMAWQMLEGRPPQDITSGGEKLIPTPIYGNKSISGYNSDKKNLPADQEDKGSVGGDISK